MHDSLGDPLQSPRECGGKHFTNTALENEVCTGVSSCYSNTVHNTTTLSETGRDRAAIRRPDFISVSSLLRFLLDILLLNVVDAE